jgi:formylglycine-generating enzyme required for sulfatase activity
MTCIPGGVFLMGAASFFKDNAANDPYPEHLVQLHAFAIDNDEVTVGTIQQLVQKHGLSAPLAADPIPAAMPQECTYGNGDPSLPITCITWAQANTACQLLGKRLPTEAEYEYVAGNLGAKTPYPWGADPNVCAKAVVARGRSIGGEPEALECLSSTAPSGPVAGGAPGDVTALGVRNLAGNVAEWVADVFDAYTGPCWAGSSPFVDPSCSAAVSGKTGHVFRGGSWQVEPFLAFSYQRDTLDPGKTINVALGFRCAVDM